MTLPASQTTVSNRVPPVQPKAVHSEYPCYAYYQAARDVPAKIVKSEAEADALGSEWGPFPWTAEKIDRTHANAEPEPSILIDKVGLEFPAYRYHQTLPHQKPVIVNSQEEADKLGPIWGVFPYSEERAALRKQLADKQALLTALETEESKVPHVPTREEVLAAGYAPEAVDSVIAQAIKDAEAFTGSDSTDGNVLNAEVAAKEFIATHPDVPVVEVPETKTEAAPAKTPPPELPKLPGKKK